MDAQLNAPETQSSSQQADDIARSIANSFLGHEESETAPDEEANNAPADSANDAGQSVEQEVHATTEIEQPSDAEPRYTVKINGEEKSVSVSELREHYQKGQAAELKFHEAAQIRHAAEAERERLMAAIVEYNSQVEAIKEASKPDWVALARENPQVWMEQKALYEQLESKQREAAEQYAALHAAHEQAQKAQFDEYIRTEVMRLVKAIPEWNTPEAYEKGAKDVSRYLSQFGFGERDIHSMNDHRIWVIAQKAMLFDKAKAEAPKQIKKAPPLKVERAGSAPGVESGTKSALGQYIESGNPDDLDAAFTEYFKGN